jgi:hypothetical protein
VENPHLILYLMLTSKEKFEEKIELLKTASTERFKILTNYSKLEVESWLVSYVNKNEDIKDTLHQISIDLEIWKVHYST